MGWEERGGEGKGGGGMSRVGEERGDMVGGRENRHRGQDAIGWRETKRHRGGGEDDSQQGTPTPTHRLLTTP